MARFIALLGAAHSGKDTVADRLVSEHGYQRLAFADPLKELALKTDPLIPTGQRDSEGAIHVRLSRLVTACGWDYAKRNHPEVRRILQDLGQGVRDMDPDFWRVLLLPKLLVASALGQRIVVTDVRYRNEAASLARCRFTLVRVTRPDLPSDEPFRNHESETELANYPTHHTITNDGTLAYLFKQVETLTV